MKHLIQGLNNKACVRVEPLTAFNDDRRGIKDPPQRHTYFIWALHQCIVMTIEQPKVAYGPSTNQVSGDISESF